jgi:hypothetical protein
MFLAVIKRVTYIYHKEEETDKRGHTAVEVFDKNWVTAVVLAF